MGPERPVAPNAPADVEEIQQAASAVASACLVGKALWVHHPSHMLLTLEVERSRASNPGPHRILVSVEDCSIDLDEDGRPDIVRCPDP
jgi:hypothetical protein